MKKRTKVTAGDAYAYKKSFLHKGKSQMENELQEKKKLRRKSQLLTHLKLHVVIDPVDIVRVENK